jgi:transposase-like protein
MKNQRVPTKITLDGYAASHRAVAELKKDGELPKRARTSKYLNNGIEQDHRRVKHRIRAIQFKIGKLGGSKATMPTFGRSQNCTRAVSTWTGTCGACATQST